MNKKLKLKEIVVVALLSALIGVVFTGLDSIYQPLQTIFGPLASYVIGGLYFVSALLSMYIVRKPGAGLLGSLFTGLINLLMGSPYGIHIIVASLLQGIGVEIGVAIFGYRKYSFIPMSVAAVLACILVTIRDYFIFGFSLYGSLIPLMLMVKIISAIVLGAGVTILLANGLKATGVLSGFNISSREEY